MSKVNAHNTPYVFTQETWCPSKACEEKVKTKRIIVCTNSHQFH